MQVVRIKRADVTYFGHLYDEDTVRLFAGIPWEDPTVSDRFLPFRRVELLPPVKPSKIICIGRNYRAHAEELGNEVPSEPMLFMKPPSSLIPSGGVIERPWQSERVEHEVELAIVMGQRARHVSAGDALDHVFGFTSVIDVTARDLQRRDGKFTRAKGFDTFCPCGPWIETDYNPSDVGLRLKVNGETRQDGRTSSMIHGVPELIAYISAIMTLEPGDLICTGTPAGVGPIVDGDHLEVTIDGLGPLTCRVVDAPGRVGR